MLGDDDASFEAKAFTELLLPELYRFRIREGREDVIKDDLGDRWRMLVHATILRQGSPLKNPWAHSRVERERRVGLVNLSSREARRVTLVNSRNEPV